RIEVGTGSRRSHRAVTESCAVLDGPDRHLRRSGNILRSVEMTIQKKRATVGQCNRVVALLHQAANQVTRIRERSPAREGATILEKIENIEAPRHKRRRRA